MKLAWLTLVVALASCKSTKHDVPDRLQVATDPRVELFSLIFGFAGTRPYGKGTQWDYNAAMAAHFKPFSRHPAVLATIALREQHGIGFDAPMQLAAYLDQDLEPIRPLEPRPPGLDARWDGVDIDAYLEQVRAFAADSDFEGFFASQQPARTAVEERFRGFVKDKQILPWFDAVFGVRPGTTYRLVPAFIVSTHNFGVHAVRPDGTEDIVMVMFLEDPTGKAFEPGEMTLGLIVHELAHSYVNRVFDARFAEIQPVFDPLFARVEPAMARQQYPSAQIALNEAVVRAVTLLYLRDHGAAGHADRALAEQDQLSFVWAGPIADALASRRTADGGALSADALFETTRAALERWAAANP
jgi:hypothetical protein